MKSIKINSNIRLFLLLISAGMSVVSCVNDKDLPEIKEQGGKLSVAADMFGTTNSRAYQAKGPVNEGTFYLLYRTLDDNDSMATVVFNGGTGAVTNQDNDFLEWTKVGYDRSGSASVATFCLDNVPLQYSSQSDARTVNFTEEYNPFKAAVFDDIEGSNDLLWGKKTVTRGTPIIEFELHHNLARLNLELTYEGYNDGPVDELDIDKAVISISNLILSPVSYNRFSGDLALPISKTEETVFYLVKPDSEKLNWKSSTTDEENHSTVYLSQDFVFPPQYLPDGEDRPRLTVTVPVKGGENQVFSGVIPGAMEVEQPNDNPTIPMSLALMKEHILTLHIKLSPEPLELVFMPVTVIDWIDLGAYSVGANQAGIYEANGFYDLIKALNENKTEELEKFGYKDSNGKWVFNIFTSMTLDYDKIHGAITSSNQGEFSFDFHGWTVTIEKSDGQTEDIKGKGTEDGYDNSAASKRLYNLMIGNAE